MNNALEFNLDFGIPARLALSTYDNIMLTVGQCGAIVVIVSDWGVSECGSIQLNSSSCGVFPETNDDLQVATRWLTTHAVCNRDSSTL